MHSYGLYFTLIHRALLIVCKCHPHYERLYYFINLIVGTALNVRSTNAILHMTLGNLCQVSIQVKMELDQAVLQPEKA